MSHTSGYLIKQFLRCIFANILGFIALAITLLLLPSLMSIKSIVVPILIISLPISLAQWIVLRRIVPVSVLWVLTIPCGHADRCAVLSKHPRNIVAPGG